MLFLLFACGVYQKCHLPHLAHSTDDEIMTISNCPICDAEMRYWERYPALICNDCDLKTVDKDGRPLMFENESLSGGCEAIYADTGEPYSKYIDARDPFNGYECYVDGYRCKATEHRFGGVAIELACKK